MAGGLFHLTSPHIRIRDTRIGGVGPAGVLHVGTPETIDLSAQVPAGATAAVLNVTAVSVLGRGWATVGGTPVGASILNWQPGDLARCNLVAVPLDAARTVTLSFGGDLTSTFHLVVDLQGWFAPISAVDLPAVVPPAGPGSTALGHWVSTSGAAIDISTTSDGSGNLIVGSTDPAWRGLISATDGRFYPTGSAAGTTVGHVNAATIVIDGTTFTLA